MFGCKPITIEDALTAQARQLRGYRRLYPQPSTMRLWSGYRRHKSHILPTIAKCYGGLISSARYTSYEAGQVKSIASTYKA